MKDLYTFDSGTEAAMQTYKDVGDAYAAFFGELKLPYVTTEATSGDMGGNLSHEYHFLSPKGEDIICSCSDCGYSANEEVAKKGRDDTGEVGITQDVDIDCWRGISSDRKTLINVFYPLGKNEGGEFEVNTYAIKALIPTLDPGCRATFGHVASIPRRTWNRKNSKKST